MKIQYCIWDVGNVVYPYSLRPLAQWLEALTGQPARQPLFDFNPYMKGLISTADMMRRLCAQYHIRFSENTAAELTRKFGEGIGARIPETTAIQKQLLQAGVTNCLLSNALPILAGSGNPEGIVKPQHVFVSYELGLLKPDLQIYQTVLQKLSAAPEEVIFVDDKADNTAAAESVGIHGIVFRRQTIFSAIHNLTALF